MLLSGCGLLGSGEKVREIVSGGLSPKELNERAEDMLDFGRSAQAIDNYRTIIAAYPTSKYAINARVQIIRPSYDNKTTTILANKTSLLRAIVNLIKNAIDFSPKGGHIEVFIVEQGEFVVITVKDMGVGISEEVKGDFGTGKSAPRADGEVGQGLGLNIVEKVMKAHNGKLIWPRNRADIQGAEVSLELPIYRAPLKGN